jgi:hypothetical protein
VSSRLLKNAGGMENIIFAVLNGLVQRHPALGLSIAGEMTQTPSWIRLDKIDLREVVQFKDVNEGYHFIEDMHQRAFDRMGELPLWRVVVVGRPPQELTSLIDQRKDEARGEESVFEVGFFYHHAIGDGKSGPAFHMDFLDILNALAGTDPVTSVLTDGVIAPPKLDLLPSVEEARTWPLSMVFIAGRILKEFVLPKNPLLWIGPPVQFSPDRLPKTRLLTLFVDSETVSRLTHRCRQNGVTITPLLGVVIARLLARRHPTEGIFTGTIALSLRRFTGVDDRKIVNHVGSVTTHFATHPKSGYLFTSGSNPFDWSVVRSCKKAIDAVAMSPANQDTILLRFLKDYSGWFKKRIGKRREAFFELSNIGTVGGGMENGGTARFTRIIFSQPASVTGPPYVFCIATVNGGDMAVALTWQDGILEDEAARDVLAALEGEIHTLANGKSEVAHNGH